MKDITIILPIYTLGEDDVTMLSNAVMSVENFYEDVALSIVCPEKLKSEVEKLTFGDKLETKFIFNTSTNTNAMYQVNLGIENCETKWFSILEIDDEYNSVWLKYMKDYTQNYTDVGIFLPIVENINVDGEFIGFTNESVWAYGFTEKQGYLNFDTLMEFQNYQTSGALYDTEVVKKFGLFKDNIKLTFPYEFLLRMTYNNVLVMGIPKVGYKHVNFRHESLFWKYKNDDSMKLTDDEVKFWIDAAKKEYFFKNKRDVIYEK